MDAKEGFDLGYAGLQPLRRTAYEKKLAGHCRVVWREAPNFIEDSIVHTPLG
jgi:hypothetical protein